MFYCVCFLNWDSVTVDWICATMFSRVVWFPDCLPWFNCAHTWESATRCRVFGVSVSMDQICEGLFGFVSEAQRWLTPSPHHLQHHPPWLLPTHPDSSTPWHTYTLYLTFSIESGPCAADLSCNSVYPGSDPPVSLHDCSTYTCPDSLTNWTFIQCLQYAGAWAYSRKRETRFPLSRSFHSGWVRNYTGKQMPGVFLTVTLQWRTLNKLKEQRLKRGEGRAGDHSEQRAQWSKVRGSLDALGKILSHKGGRVAGV